MQNLLRESPPNGVRMNFFSASHIPSPSQYAGQNCISFSHHEMAAATNGFANKSVIGEGGFGKVYKRQLGNNTKEVAINVLKIESALASR